MTLKNVKTSWPFPEDNFTGSMIPAPQENLRITVESVVCPSVLSNKLAISKIITKSNTDQLITHYLTTYLIFQQSATH